MTPKVIIIDYQLGNLFSVQQACEYLGFQPVISSSPEELINADFAILPGVGAFADAVANLRQFGLTDAINEFVKKGNPLMGVCLGLQLLLTESEEFGASKGLDLIGGHVKKFPVTEQGSHVFKVPQIQWNSIYEPAPGRWSGTPLAHCSKGDFMYFVHSFYATPVDSKYVLSTTSYAGLEYCSAVMKDNVFATQFHPEKSGLYGLNIYKSWFSQFQ